MTIALHVCNSSDLECHAPQNHVAAIATVRERQARIQINSEGVKVMSRNQRGEAMVAVMLVVLLIAMAGRGHMGMMGHGDDGNRQGGTSESSSTSQSTPPPAKPASGHQH